MSITAPRTIIVASDLSPETRRLLSYAVEHHHAPHARLVLVHVVAVAEHVWAALSRAYAADDVKEKLFTMADDLLRDLSATHAAESPMGIEVQVHWGDPAEVLLDVARSEGAELVVMGRHAPSSVRSFVLGGVTDKVLRRATCPVAVLPMGRPT
jgi:nucleotide-binding universal stress UspA family protein